MMPGPRRDQKIVHRYADGSFVTQAFSQATGEWNHPTSSCTRPATRRPATCFPRRSVCPRPLDVGTARRRQGVAHGLEFWHMMKEEMGEQGVLGIPSGTTTFLGWAPRRSTSTPTIRGSRKGADRDRAHRAADGRHRELDAWPDFLFCGGSGTLVWQSPESSASWRFPSSRR